MPTVRCSLNYLLFLLFCACINLLASDLKASEDVIHKFDKDTTIFYNAQEMPYFDGNIEVWLGENIHYPKEAWEAGIGGRVIVSFVVEADGSISNAKVLRGVHPSLEAEAVRVIGTMPKWVPAKISGNAVRIHMTMPLLFRIKQASAGIRTYEDFVAMLDQEAKISLDEIDKEQDKELLDILIAGNREIYRNDADAYRAVRAEIQRKMDAAIGRAEGLLDCYGFRSARVKDLSGIFIQIATQKLELVDKIGITDFIERYAAISPRIRHLQIMEEALLKDCLNTNEYSAYFEQEIRPMIREQEDVGRDSCSYDCIFHILPPVTQFGDMNRALGRTVKYPIIAQERNIQGEVWVNYTVGIDGVVSDASVIRGVHPSLDNESVRAMKAMLFIAPAYCPIHQRKVAFRSVAPINFRMQ